MFSPKQIAQTISNITHEAIRSETEATRTRNIEYVMKCVKAAARDGNFSVRLDGKRPECLQVGARYQDKLGYWVKIVEKIQEDDGDYHLGYRYRGEVSYPDPPWENSTPPSSIRDDELRTYTANGYYSIAQNTPSLDLLEVINLIPETIDDLTSFGFTVTKGVDGIIEIGWESFDKESCAVI